MTKKYRLVSDNNNQNGGNSNYDDHDEQAGGMKVLMPLASPVINTMIPALPTINTGIVSNPPPIMFGPPINLMPQSRNNTISITSPRGVRMTLSGPNDAIANLLFSAKNPLSPNSDGLPDSLSASAGPNIKPGQWIILKSLHNNNILHFNNGNSIEKYSGAGLVIFEADYMGAGPTILLFRSTSNGSYYETGGKIDIADYAQQFTLENASRRETLEESCNYVSAYNFGAEYVNVPAGKYMYRCYYIVLGNGVFNSTTYLSNRARLIATGSPASYLETDDVQRFYLTSIARCISVPGNVANCIDVNGINRVVSGRTLKCIREFYNRNIIANLNSKIKNVTQQTNNAHDFKNGTVTLAVQ